MLRLFTPEIVILAAAALVAVCDSGRPAAPRIPTTVRLTLEHGTVEVGQSTTARATALDKLGERIRAGRATFASATPGIAAVSPTTGAIVGIAPGTTLVSATIGGRSDQRAITVVGAPIRINEIESGGSGPGGWVELFNPTSMAVDVSGWMVTGRDALRGFSIPAGQAIPAGGYLVIDEIDFPLGLQASGAVHLFSRFGIQVDGYAWSATSISWGRCPDGSGKFVTLTEATRGSANACSRAGDESE